MYYLANLDNLIEAEMEKWYNRITVRVQNLVPSVYIVYEGIVGALSVNGVFPTSGIMVEGQTHARKVVGSNLAGWLCQQTELDEKISVFGSEPWVCTTTYHSGIEINTFYVS